MAKSESVERHEVEHATKRAFAKVLKQARSTHKGGALTQEALAYEAGYDRTYIYKLEKAMYQPSLSSFITLSKQLGISPITMLRAVLKEMERL